MIVQYIVGALFLVWTLMQFRMVLVYLGIVPSTLGIVGSPKLVLVASLDVIISPIRAVICFVVPWPMLLPALTATLVISPLVFALAYFRFFGDGIAHAAHPILNYLTDKGRKEHPIMVIRQTLIWVVVVSLLTGGLWYFFAK
jgi:hypothetical protein